MWGVTSVLAVILGLVARRQIKERNESGDGMAIAGIVLGILGILGAIGMIILIVAFSDEVDTYDEYQNIDVIRSGLTMVWTKASAGLAGIRSALPGA